ncbi:MAG: hypothetical protein HQ483_03305 [Rhodospirillales bacterium]|nr:hypothetical protein [Rhodospirillales bacterium]
MIRRLALSCFAVAPLLLGGCTLLPVSFQVASMALDGISMLTTHKSLTDHGISTVTQQDCALWRGLTGDAVCQDYEDQPETLLAALDSSALPGATSQDQPALDALYLSVN